MDFKSAMLELLEDNYPTLRVIPKGDKRHTYELAIRYCEDLDDEILMCRYVSKDGNMNDWEPIAYLFCDEDVIDGEWEIVPDTEVRE